MTLHIWNFQSMCEINWCDGAASSTEIRYVLRDYLQTKKHGGPFKLPSIRTTVIYKSVWCVAQMACIVFCSAGSGSERCRCQWQYSGPLSATVFCRPALLATRERRLWLPSLSCYLVVSFSIDGNTSSVGIRSSPDWNISAHLQSFLGHVQNCLLVSRKSCPDVAIHRSAQFPSWHGS